MQSLGHLPFTGRDEELALLHDIYIHTLHNERQTVLIEGEAGVGKSTLVNRFLDELGSEGAMILKTYGAPSFAGFRTVFGGLLRSFLSSATPRDVSASNLFELGTAGALARLAPEVRDMIPFDISPTQEEPPNPTHEMEQTLDGLRLFILRLATRKPLVILFEDAHWFDSRTWEAINSLGRTLGPYPILFVITLRSSELDDECERIYRSLWRNKPTERVLLSRFESANSRRIIERLFGVTIADNIALEVHDSTGGNPLFIHETLNTLVERGLVQFNRETNTWKQTVELQGKLPSPEAATYIFQERIAGFKDSEVDLFRLAALLGLQFRAEWLKELSGLSEDGFIQFLNRSLKANLLVSDFQGGLSFYHQLIQQNLLDTIPAQRRTALRLTLYEYFIKRTKTHPTEGPFHQFLAMQEYEPSFAERYGVDIVEHNLHAAINTFSSFSTSLSIRYLETAREALSRLNPNEQEDSKQLLYKVYFELGRTALESGRARKAVIYFRCISMFLLGHVTLDLAEQIRLLRSLAEAHFKTANYQRIANYVNRAVALATGVDTSLVIKELVQIQFISGLSQYNQGQYESATRETERGLAMLAEREIRDPQLELAGLRTKGIILNRIGRHTEAEKEFLKSLSMAEKLNDKREIGRAHYYLGVVRQYIGQFNLAMSCYQRSIAICREVDDLDTLSKIYNNLGVHYSESGDPSEAERNFRRALEVQIQIGAVYTALTSRINLAGSIHSSGHTEEALAETKKVFEECIRINAVNLIPAIFDSEVEIALDAGKLDHASETLDKMRTWLETAESNFGLDQLKKLSGRLAILRGEFKSGWKELQETVKIYVEKGESFRAAQAMAEGAILICETKKSGAKIPESILKTVEIHIKEALSIYDELNFNKRIEQLQKKILAADSPTGRFGKLVSKATTTKPTEPETHNRHRALVRCFGRLKVTCPGRHDEIDEKAWPSKKARVLLAYLSVGTTPGRALSRDKICDALWGHLGPDTIMSSFHVTLSNLRKTLSTESTKEYKNSEIIIHQDGNYNLGWGDNYWCDIQEFDALYQSGKRYLSENKVHLTARDFEKARVLYQGPLLEDMYDSWLEGPRDNYRRKNIEISQRLAEIYFDKTEYDRTLALSQEVLLVDPTEEQAHRLLMLTLFTIGRKAAAVNQYNACVKSLQQRLEIEPDQKTVDLAKLIKSSSAKLNELSPTKAKTLFV